jgi:cytoskeleton protein RodZ
VGISPIAMAKSTRLPASNERNSKRRLHLREIKDDPHAQLDSVGATLRAARLNRGEDPEHVATVLKMKREHIEAIEDNDFTRLPGRTYAIGFVRSYARYLGLDAEVMVQRFKEESAGREHDRPVELVFPDAPEEKRAANGSLVLVAVLIAAAIAGAYYVSMPQRQAAVPAPKPEDAAVVVAGDQPRFITDGPITPEVSSDLAQPSSLLGDGATAQPGASAPLAAAQMPATPAAVPAATAAAPADASRVFGTENVNSRIVFRANAEAYILVKELGPNGKVTLVDRTLKAGESYRAPDKPGVTIITGNAGGLDVEIDGKKMGQLGKSGEMLRNVPVDASYMVERFASGLPMAPPVAPKAAAPKPAPAPAPATPAIAPPPAAASTSEPPAAPPPAPAQ